MFCMPFQPGEMKREDDNESNTLTIMEIDTPRSLRLMMISIFVIFVVSFLQFSWSAGYHSNWMDSADHIREKLIPTILPPNFDDMDWTDSNAEYSTVANRYKLMLLGFSADVKTKVSDLNEDATNEQYRTLYLEAATNLAKYLDTTCFPLYDMVLLQNLIIYIFSLTFLIVTGAYIFLSFLSHSFGFCNNFFNHNRLHTQRLETFMIVFVIFTEIIIIAFGLSSIFFLVYQDYTVTLWTRQNNNYEAFSTTYTPLNLARLFNARDIATMPTQRFNGLDNRASKDYRCFNLYDAFDSSNNKGSNFKEQMHNIYQKKTNPKENLVACEKENYKALKENKTCAVKFEQEYLPFEKVPPAIPKLHWDIIISSVVFILCIMRNIVLATEYTAHSADFTSTNQMYGGLGVRAAVPQASYAYAPPGVFVMQ